jgi:hypothetical protein
MSAFENLDVKVCLSHTAALVEGVYEEGTEE